MEPEVLLIALENKLKENMRDMREIHKLRLETFQLLLEHLEAGNTDFVLAVLREIIAFYQKEIINE